MNAFVSTTSKSSPFKRAASVEAACALLRSVDVDGSTQKELEDLASILGRAKSLVAWLLCEIARVAAEADPGLGTVDMLKDSVRLSGKEAKQISAVGGALAEMPNVARELAEGRITISHAASLASAARECGADVVDSDEELLKQAVDVGADRFARVAREFASRHSEDNGVSKLERQRKRRQATLFTDGESGMGILRGEFDPVSFNLMQQTIDTHAEALWRGDGGLDGKPSAIRSHKQRICDAVFELITGKDAASHDPLPVEGTETLAKRAKAAAQLIVLADIGALDGTNPQGRCEIHGTGRVPTDIIRSLSPDTELAGLIFGGKSRPLWLGRSQRLASAAQRLALAVRDGGCVLCDEPTHRCQIHHIKEWNTEGGKTDLDNLATLCGRHHRWLHNHGKTLVRKREGGWKVCDKETAKHLDAWKSAKNARRQAKGIENPAKSSENPAEDQSERPAEDQSERPANRNSFDRDVGQTGKPGITVIPKSGLSDELKATSVPARGGAVGSETARKMVAERGTDTPQPDISTPPPGNSTPGRAGFSQTSSPGRRAKQEAGNCSPGGVSDREVSNCGASKRDDKTRVSDPPTGDSSNRKTNGTVPLQNKRVSVMRREGSSTVLRVQSSDVERTFDLCRPISNQTGRISLVLPPLSLSQPEKPLTRIPSGVSSADSNLGNTNDIELSKDDSELNHETATNPVLGRTRYQNSQRGPPRS